MIWVLTWLMIWYDLNFYETLAWILLGPLGAWVLPWLQQCQLKVEQLDL